MVPISINVELSMALKHTPVALIVQLVPLEANLDKHQLLAVNIELWYVTVIWLTGVGCTTRSSIAVVI